MPCHFAYILAPRPVKGSQLAVLVGLFCSLSLLPASVFAATATPARYAIQCGALLDTPTDTTRKNVVVVTEGGIVKQILNDGSAIPADATKIDLRAGFCLPGLIDVHDHLTGSPSDSGYESLGVSIPRQTISGVKHARLTLLAGFTTVRNVGADGFTDVALRDAINAGDVAGPWLFVSGPALGITGGHCDNNLLAPEFKFHAEAVADGPWAARARVRENIKYGVDLIKICASGGVLSKGDLPGAPQYTLEEMQAIAQEAHKLGRKVAAHAHGTQSIKDAIVAGIDSIEHASLIDDEGIRLAKEHHTYLVFDIYNDDYILQEGPKVGMLPESIEKEKAIEKLQRANFRKAYLAGAPLAFGTDSGVYPHGDNAKQFATMVEFGMKPVEAIHAATVNSADLLNLVGKAGVVKEGSWADIIAVDGDPTKNAELLQHVKFVMRDGKIYRDDWQPSIALLAPEPTNTGAPATR